MIRITNISKRMMQCSLMLMLFMVQSVAASAETKLYMENFSIANGDIKEVALLLDNDKEATVLQAKIDLPAGLEYVKESVAKTSRVKGRAATVQASEETGQLVIVETDGTITAGEGAVITFQVKRTDAIDGDFDLKISDIVVSDADANQLNTEEEQNVTVKYIGLGDCSFAAPEAISVAVGQEYQIDVTLKNDGVDNLSAFQGKLALPEGLEIVEGEEGKFIYTDRIPAKAEFKFKESDGNIQFVLSSSSNDVITGVEGAIFSFKVKATDALAENTEIKLTDLRVAATTGQSAEAEDVTISVTNTSVADKAAFEAYQAEQAAAVEALAKEDDSEASKTIIAEAKVAVEAMTFDYEKSLDEQKAAVDEIVTNAAAALEAQREAEAAEAAAVEAANAKVAELKTAAEALAVSEEAKAYEAENVQAAVTAAEVAIAAVAPAIAAVEAVIAEGKLATENKEALETAIAAAEDAIAAAEDAIKEAQETYETQKQTDDDAKAAEEAAVTEANEELTELKTAAEALAVPEEVKAYEAENVQAAVAKAEEAIAAVTPAIEAVEAIIAEGKLSTDNKEAYDAAVAAAEESVTAATAEIAEAQNTYKNQKQIDDATEAGAKASAEASLTNLQIAMEDATVSEEAKAYEAENVQAAVVEAEEAIAAAEGAIAAVEAIIAEGKLATDNKVAVAKAINAAQKAVNAAQDAVAVAEKTYIDQKAADEAAIPGDVNKDGKVDVGDLVSVSNFMAGEAESVTLADADVNKDGKVDVGDLVSISNIMAGNE